MERRFGSFFYKKQPATPGEPERKGVLQWTGGFIRKACFIVGAIVLFCFALGILSSVLLGGRERMPDDMILVLNLTDPIAETEHGRTLSDPFAAPGMTVRTFVDMMDKAAKDKRVRGLLVSLDTGAMELTHIQEVRAAVKRFRGSGKFAHIYTASFADLRSGIGAYYLASAFDEIWMQPVGLVSITGLSLEMPFAKKALDKIGANPEFLHREEYKSAMEGFTNTEMSPANKRAMQSILDDLSQQIFADIAMDRQLKDDALRLYIDKGLVTGKAAVDTKLITKLGYADELIDSVREKITGEKNSEEPPLVIAEDYAEAVLEKKPAHTNDVAVVQIAGQIVPGSEPEPGFAPGDYIASAIMDAADMDSIKVILVRVDSPGGSPSASETIRRAIVHAKEKGKKVVVSMGPVAASGGYWVAVDADRIYAMPSTLTGSIGVIMGKFEISGLWDKIGVNWDGVSWGKNAKLWSSNKPVNADELAVLNEAIDDTYASFIARVAEGRKMEAGKVREVAKGRAWTGTQARANGLVDEIGGFDSALDHAAKLAGVEDRTKLRLIDLPKPLTPFQQIMKLMGSQVSLGSVLPFLKSAEPELREMNALERLGPVQARATNLPRIRP